MKYKVTRLTTEEIEVEAPSNRPDSALEDAIGPGSEYRWQNDCTTYKVEEIG